VGDAAPNVTVTDPQGQPVTLDHFWANGPTLITFLRHFG
jgi:hypothetical protein